MLLLNRGLRYQTRTTPLVLKIERVSPLRMPEKRLIFGGVDVVIERGPNTVNVFPDDLKPITSSNVKGTTLICRKLICRKGRLGKFYKRISWTGDWSRSVTPPQNLRCEGSNGGLVSVSQHK